MFRFLKTLLNLALLVMILAIGFSIYHSIYGIRSSKALDFSITQGMSVRTIASRLWAQGVIKTPKIFIYYSKFKHLDNKMKAGLYELKAGMTLAEIAQKFVSGQVKQFPVQFIEGWNIRDYALTIQSNPMLGIEMANDFLKLVNDQEFISSMPFFRDYRITSLEGYLFPETYLLSGQRSASMLVDAMLKEFIKVYDEEAGSASVAPADLDRNEKVILASIVEKETGNSSERALVASVFYNRLKKGMPLQSDPTVIYGLKNFDGNLRKADLSNPHAYNTYVHSGLPPGPICNPGRDSIRAVFHPAQTDYLYFVSKNDGTHEFSASLQDHARAVMRYQIKNSNK